MRVLDKDPSNKAVRWGDIYATANISGRRPEIIAERGNEIPFVKDVHMYDSEKSAELAHFYDLSIDLPIEQALAEAVCVTIGFPMCSLRQLSPFSSNREKNGPRSCQSN